MTIEQLEDNARTHDTAARVAHERVRQLVECERAVRLCVREVQELHDTAYQEMSQAIDDSMDAQARMGAAWDALALARKAESPDA